MMAKTKKASLNLSINAIVVLILAISMLGLGLTFVRGLFKQAEGKVTEITSASDIANPPNFDNPMTITPGQIKLRNNEQKSIDVAYLNSEGDTRDCSLRVRDPVGVVVKPGNGVTYDGKTITDIAIYNIGKVSVKPDGINVWTVAIDGKKYKEGDSATDGTLLLTTEMCCKDLNPRGGGDDCTTDATQVTRDIVITVTS